MSKREITLALTPVQYDEMIAAFTEYDVALAELYDDESVYVQRVQVFVRMCRMVTRGRWEPPQCVEMLQRPDFRGRMKGYR